MVGSIQELMLAILEAARKKRDEMTGGICNGARHRSKLVHATARTLGDSATARRIRQIGNRFPCQGTGAARGWKSRHPGIPWDAGMDTEAHRSGMLLARVAH